MKGSPLTHAMGEGASLVTDIPRYRVYENGVFTKELTDASAYWKEGYVGFLIGCSFSFEEALLAADEVVICNALMPVVPVRAYGHTCWSSRELFQFLAPLCEQTR